MTKQSKIIINGRSLRRERERLQLTQQQLSDRYRMERKQLLDRFPKSRERLPHYDISRIENSQPQDEIASQKEQTVEVLASIFEVPVKELIADEVDNASMAAQSTERVDVDKTASDTTDIGLAFDLPRVELPFISVRARASFVEVCGSVHDYGPEETLTYLLPPRPITEYVNNKSRVFEVNGDSMSPEIRTGERIIADPVPESRWELLTNKIIVISYDETLTIKWVRENELLTRRVLTLYPNLPGLAPLTVRRELIKCIFVVRESFERKKWD